MGMTARRATKPLVGREKPRLAPPTPARSAVADFVSTAETLGMDLFPWQRVMGRYAYALGPGDQWLYPEVAIVVARQNGKTELLVPHVMCRLAMGRRIMHAAQTRELPRKMFLRLALLVEAKYPDAKVRRGAGQETIEVPSTGGSYQIIAASGGAPRGSSMDDLMLDELRELEEDFVGAALPTVTVSQNPQVLYLSNAGHDGSDVLNAVRARADSDPALAYLEWSASPDRSADDLVGWAEANPSIGHFPHLIASLERTHRSAVLSGNLARFETEHLCRWVASMREHLVDQFAWGRGRLDDLEEPRRAAMAVSMSPDGKRASCAVAWMRDDLSVGLRLLYNVTGDPIDSALLGADIAKTASSLQIKEVGYDPLTDAEVIKYFKTHQKPVKVHGQLFSNASAQFVNLVNADHIRWKDADAVTDDLTWTSRKQDAETGSYQAVRAQDDRSITASLAAIRAVWLASGPKPVAPKVVT
jgi:phage terminase large subunit-like protein